MQTGNLVTNESGDLVYEEISIDDMDKETPYKVRLNELGEEDTIITLVVTAEDRKNNKRV